MVRLLTVIGHRVNLLPHFIKHYKRYVDEINIAIYKTDLYPTLEEDINETIMPSVPSTTIVPSVQKKTTRKKKQSVEFNIEE